MVNGLIIVGCFLHGILLFIILPVFLYYLIRVLIEAIRINMKALKIEVGDSEKEKFEQNELDFRNEIKNERIDSEHEIFNKVLGMDEDAIDKSLESLEKS